MTKQLASVIDGAAGELMQDAACERIALETAECLEGRSPSGQQFGAISLAGQHLRRRIAAQRQEQVVAILLGLAEGGGCEIPGPHGERAPNRACRVRAEGEAGAVEHQEIGHLFGNGMIEATA